MTINRIHHLGLTVTDVEASAEWYRSVLGFDRIGDHTSLDGARRKVFLRHDRLDARLGLCQHSTTTGDRFDERRVGLDHLAFVVDDVDELRDWETRLRAHEVPYTQATPANTLEGTLVVVFRDPDNIQLELIADSGRTVGQSATS
jgi:glyoxylase I family protein